MGKPASRLLTLPWPFINMWPSSWLEHCFDKEVIGSREAELSLWLLFWWVEFAKHNFSEDGMQKKSSGHQNHKFSCTWKALFFGPPIAFNTVLCVFLNIFDPSLLNWSSHILTVAHICIDPTSEQNKFTHFVQSISIMHYFGKNIQIYIEIPMRPKATKTA